MRPAPSRSILRTLTTLLSIQVAAFLLFHLNFALIFDIRFIRIMQIHDWLGVAHSILLFATLYVPVAAMVWMIFRGGHARGLVLAMAGVTLWSAASLYYPLLTGVLHLIGQFDRAAVFAFESMPPLSDYPLP